ncbi:ATP-binding cassette domain-containing protein [Streptomyces sp. NPDC002896]|uniref:ATP-binding cassette domain-containing protein n=1 Tax=Streptomyces sp. NPDC002896 TaxID=3154438 RepID=UPI00332B12B6
MIQAIGLTSNPRKKLPPAVDDVTFEALPGHVTALLGGPASGKTTTLRLMLELQPGRGVTYFRNRRLHCMPHPSREVGVLLGEVLGHPARTVRGHLRMLCAAAGVPAQRADEVLEAVGLVSLRGERLDTLSRGLDRRLGLACALLADPHTLVLDVPAEGLSAREGRWLHGTLRAHAAKGGTVLFSTDDPKGAAQTSDRVVTLDAGRVVADQGVAEFARTRLRPRVAVRTPYAARLGLLLTKEARAGQRSIEVIKEDGNRLSVYGSTCADVGEIAYRHGILVHQLADEVGDMGPKPITTSPEHTARPHHAPPLESESDLPEAPPAPDPRQEASAQRHEAPCQPQDAPAQRQDTPAQRHETPAPRLDNRRHPATRTESDPPPQLPPPITVRPARGPLRPLRYELYRAAGVGTGYVTAAVVLAVSAFVSLFLARSGHTSQSRVLAAWPQELPLPPTALGAGLLGAFAFGDEFRHPALATDRGTVPRRLGLLCAKLGVAAATALLLAFLTVGCDAALLQLVYGPELTRVPVDWLSLSASWFGVVAGCAWAGVLAAGIFRSTTAGLAAVVSVPVVVVPLVQKALERPSARSAAGFPGRLRDLAFGQWPFGAERYLAAGVRMIIQPVGGALTLCLTALLCAYGLTALRSRVR